MRVSYSYPSGLAGAPRPLVPVSVAGSDPIDSLVDSGAIGIRMPLAIAWMRNIDLTEADESDIRIGGATRRAYTVEDVALQIGPWSWKARVAFIGHWNDHPILGTKGFFDEYDVDFRFGRHEEFHLRPRQ